MYAYFAYGLGIHSNVILPEFLPAEIDCDVAIYVKEDREAPIIPSEKPFDFHVNLEESTFFISRVGNFIVRHGREIIVNPLPNANTRTIQLYIAEAIMTVLLYQRNMFVLHGSAVEIDGSAITFIGDSGSGKSSIAAALTARGHAILTDDVIAISFDSGAVNVQPGIPQLKLSAETAAALGLNVESLPPVHLQEEKYVYRNTLRFPRNPPPLKRIYVVDTSNDGDLPRITPIRPQEALVMLVRHSYGARTLQRGRKTESYFFQSAHLARQVPIFSLHRPTLLSQLPDLARFIEDCYT
jgi:hypothetical protein